jgi:alkyl sulfatase BDS1-like metallo-beta-lactamase superfamily hydrolase
MADPYQVTRGIHPDLAAHGAIFARKIYRVAGNVYCAVGWSTCNSIMVVGRDGVIIVDTGDSVTAAREVAAEFRKIIDKPVLAVIYTCFHIDHISGVKGFVSAEDVSAGLVAVIAHDTLLANVINQGSTIGAILGARTAYNFGVVLDDPDLKGLNLGTGPLPRKDREVTFIAPTRTFSSMLDLAIAGVELKLVHVPSEAADEIAVFLPENSVLLSSEVIPAQCFPVLHPLRGEAYRDPMQWYRSIDALRRLNAASMVPAHGLPVIGAERVEEVLRSYRDAIQFVHDQTVRQMNKGLTPDELAAVVKLPPHLASYTPWMQEFFGTVSQAVRAVYQGYLGWFEGDPVALAPLARAEQARRVVELMGGRGRVIEVAENALSDDDPQWAAELATLLIRIDRDDAAARRIKAASFRKQGYAQINAIWRNWYLSGARELERIGPPAIRRVTAKAGLGAPDLIAALPASTFIDGLPTRLKAEETCDVTITVGFHLSDSHQSYGIRLRRGVAEIEHHAPDKADFAISLDKRALDQIRTGQLAWRDGIDRGGVQLTGGSVDEVERFFGYFEEPGATSIQLVVR